MATKARKPAKDNRTKEEKLHDAEVGRKILALREGRGETQDEIGKKIGVTQTTVDRWEDGWHCHKRSWNKIAELAGVSVPEFFFGVRSNRTRTTKGAGRSRIQGHDIIKYEIQSEVGGGEWIEIQAFEEPMGVFFDILDDNFPINTKRVAFRVRGDSMDLSGIADGCYIEAVEFSSSGANLETGMIVVVEEFRDGGHLVRRTVKEVHIFKDRYELRPRSRNPVHQTITIPLHYPAEPDEEVEVTVIAIVTGVRIKINPFKWRRRK